MCHDIISGLGGVDIGIKEGGREGRFGGRKGRKTGWSKETEREGRKGVGGRKEVRRLGRKEILFCSICFYFIFICFILKQNENDKIE